MEFDGWPEPSCWKKRTYCYFGLVRARKGNSHGNLSIFQRLWDSSSQVLLTVQGGCGPRLRWLLTYTVQATPENWSGPLTCPRAPADRSARTASVARSRVQNRADGRAHPLRSCSGLCAGWNAIGMDSPRPQDDVALATLFLVSCRVELGIRYRRISS
jgi:hypothetical protein